MPCPPAVAGDVDRGCGQSRVLERLVDGDGFRAEVKPVHVDDRVEDGAGHSGRTHRGERRAVLDNARAPAVVPDEMRDVVNVGMRARGDRRETDGCERGKRRDGARVVTVLGQERERGNTIVTDGVFEHRRRQPVDDDQDQPWWPGRAHWWMCGSRAPSETRTQGVLGLKCLIAIEDPRPRCTLFTYAGLTP